MLHSFQQLRAKSSMMDMSDYKENIIWTEKMNNKNNQNNILKCIL